LVQVMLMSNRKESKLQVKNVDRDIFHRAFALRLVIIIPTMQLEDWFGLSSVSRPRQHSIGYVGDGF